MNWLRRRETWLAVGGGALAALSMPGFGAVPLAFVAYIPLFFALERGRGFLHGYLFGLTLFAIDVRWVLALVRFNALVAPGYILLVLYLALPFGLFGWLMARGAGRSSGPWNWILFAPALVVLAEALRTLGPLGIGFSMLHQALYRVPWLIQSAAVLGSWSITAFIAAANGALFLACRNRELRFVLLALAVFAAQAAFSLDPAGSGEDGSSLAVAVVSSNVDQAVKLDGRNLSHLTERFLGLGDEAVASDPDLIVFPESFLPAYILDVDPVLSQLTDLAQAGNARLLFGTGTYRDGKIYNSTVLLSATGGVAATYDMVRPVPFGEYIPGRSLLEAIGLGAWARGLLPVDLSRGATFRPLEELGTPICFESTFSTASRRFTQAGATLLVTVTNDAWFAGSSELSAHFAAAVFRAVENRRAIVQAANGGISGIVDARGRILAETPEETVLTGRVRHATARAIYTRLGDAPFVLAMALVAGLYLVARQFGRARQSET